MDLAEHWETVYRSKDPSEVSWYQPRPDVSLELLEGVVSPQDALIDVGAGASTLADHLVAAGHTDLTLVDISATALDRVVERLGENPVVHIEVADVRSWTPSRRFDAWHDRAVFHFLTDESDRAAYRRALSLGLRPGGHAIVSTFHLTGPELCSGLPTARYDAAGLVEALGGVDVFERVHDRIEEHPHPRGGTQTFQVVLVRRR